MRDKERLHDVESGVVEAFAVAEIVFLPCTLWQGRVEKVSS